MSFNWESYIKLAGDLINYQKTPDIKEAYLRSSMSRSYYGIFCIARNLLKRRGVTIKKIDTHRFVREEYQNSTNRIEKKVAKDLSRLWKERKDADYEDIAVINMKRAKTALYLSRRTLSILKKLV